MSGQVKEVSVQYQVSCHSCDSVDSVGGQVYPPGYKQTEVGMIPEDWEAGELGDYLESCSSGATPYRGTPKFYKGNIRWISSGELNYNVIYDTIEKISDDAVKKTNLKIHPKGTFLMAITGLEAAGTRGSCGIIGAPSATNQSCMALYPNKKLSTDFLFHYYVYKGDELALKYCQGTKQQSYTAKLVRKLPFIVPGTIEEQAAIANVLSDVDALITSLEKFISKKRAIKTAAMQQLLTGKKRLPQFDLTHTGYKQTELGEIPEDWEVVELGRVLSIRHGKSQKEVECENGKYPVLATGGEIGRTNIALYDKPSVLIGRKGTIDKPVYMDTPFWTVDTLFYSEVSQNFHAKFIYYKFCQIDWMSYNEASGVPSLNASTIENVLQAVPCDIKEQRAIAGVLSDIDMDIRALEQRLNKTQQLKQGMMQELLTGRTRLI